VNDPRDAVLAVAWAERLSKVRWPAWVMPRERPHGKRRWLWLLDLTGVVAAVVVALISSWSSIPGSWRWPLVGVFVYWTIVTPITIARGLRTYWNAPEAAEKNRQLLPEGNDPLRVTVRLGGSVCLGPLPAWLSSCRS
jgi:hypothetical protein